MMAARAKKEAVRQVNRENYTMASELLKNARDQVLLAPYSPRIYQEAQILAELEADLQTRQLKKLRKRISADTFDTTFVGISRCETEYQAINDQPFNLES